MIEDSWDPFLNYKKPSLKQTSGNSVGKISETSWDPDRNQRILLQSSPILYKRSPQNRTILLTSRESLTFLRKSKLLAKLEKQPNSFSSFAHVQSTSCVEPTRLTQVSRTRSSEIDDNWQSITVAGLRSSYVLKVPRDSNIEQMIDICWQRIYEL